MNDWKSFSLGELCEDISYGYTASSISDNFGPKFLRITDIVPDRINWEKVPFCIADQEVINKYKLQNDDIVIARTGATTGYNKIIKNINVNAIFASYLIRFRIDKKLAYPGFIGHVLQSDNWYDYIDAIAGGSAQPGANAKELASYEILLPPVEQQKAIASVLSSLDDKIDLLHRQNKTLEAMAETLFRQWFIEEADEYGEWGKLDDILTAKGGSTPRTDNSSFWNGDISWVTPRDLSNNPHLFINSTERKITEKGLNQISSGLLPIGTILLSSRAPIGYLAITEIPLAINQGFIAIIDNKEYSKEFIYMWLKSKMDYIIGSANGSTFLEINKNVFRELKIVKVPKNVRNEFDNIVKPVFRKIKNNTYQIKTLIKLKEVLLPNLISGKIKLTS